MLHALWHGNFARRRHAPRRSTDRPGAPTDWFHAQWLAVGILVLLLSFADALLTLTLIAFYSGALIIVAAMIWLLVVAWRESKPGLFFLALAYFLMLGGAGLYIWLRGRRFDIPQVVGGA